MPISYEEFQKLPPEEQAAFIRKIPAGTNGAFPIKIGEKGGVSVYLGGRYPVTLYADQWLRLLERADDIRKFIESNKERLKSR